MTMASQTPEVEFPITLFDQIPFVEMPERISILEAVSFKKTCHKLLQANSLPEKIVLDFDRTTFIDSSGVGSLVNNLKASREKGVDLILQNVHPQVMAVFSMTGLDQVLKIQAPLFPSKSQSSGKKQDHQLPETHPSIRSWLKRFIDIVGALVGLIITGILFIPIVIAIKIDSPGPIFFGQTRCGWMGKRFRIWKFRSMCDNAELMKDKVKNEIKAEGRFFKNKNDPRITRVGRFLRKTSLDELPQFWNVLKGEMSLVGTRPPTIDEVEKYDVPEWQRFDVKPGMTGEWQVSGRSQIRNFEDVIKLDLRYQKNWSLVYDLRLILKTILILFDRNSGAV